MAETREFHLPRRTPAADIEALLPEDLLPHDGADIPEGCARARLAADLRAAAARFGARPKDLLIVSGLGGAPDITSLISCYGVRVMPDGVLPFAAGALRANPSLTTVALVPHSTGVSLGRLVEAARADLDLTCLVINGGCRQRGARYDCELAGIAGSVGTGLIARVQPGDEDSAGTVFTALQRKGFSLIEVIGRCASCGSEDGAKVPDGRGVLLEKPVLKRGRPPRLLERGAPSPAEKEKLWETLR